jgi:membrane protease YdiL (CAAX protease family)
MGDIVLGVPFIFVAVLLGMAVSIPFIAGDGLGDLADGTSEDLPVAILATSLAGQQIGQGLWPFVVSWWKGLGPVADWRLRFEPVDLAIGLGTAIIAIGAAAVISAVVSNLVNLTDDADADNTQFLRDAEGTPWLYVLIVSVIVGAPLAEELFFRGLTLRAIEKRAGPVAAVIGSTVLFTLPHFIGTGLAGTVVLFASIGVVGAVLGTITVVVGRLWPAIFAHMAFNALGAAGALGAFDSVT